MNKNLILGLIIGVSLSGFPVMGGEVLENEASDIVLDMEAGEAATSEDELVQQDEAVPKDELPQSICMEGIKNARELGGYMAEDGRTVRHGVILRSAKLSEPTERDVERLKDEFHLATLLDFRTVDEAMYDQNQEIDGVTYLSLPIINAQVLEDLRKKMGELQKEGVDTSDDILQMKLAKEFGIIGPNMYINFLSGDNGKKGYKRMFEELLKLEDDESLIFQCTHGKDRTGCAAMLILSALGVDEETIMEDFLLTNEYMADEIEHYRKLYKDSGLDDETVNLLLVTKGKVERSTMENALNWIHENYGSPVGYIIEELEVTEEDIEKLKDHFLE